ncbi:MAG TPA: glycerophosphodiester phosphodiesterase family protein [Bdellovibrionales bacterium]|nr:glycerophosphodiester phosphodiesterase family protein [Bdellovibrionales bacterium]
MKSLLLCSIIAFSQLASAFDESLPARGVFGHRGSALTHPENTLSSLRAAVEMGAHGVEFDVRQTSDGHLVLMHDATVDRTTDGSGKLAKMTLAQIKALDAGSWKHSRFAGERVPTLAEVLEIMPKNIWLDVHVKDDSAVMKIAQQVIAYGFQDSALIGCDGDNVEPLRKLDPRLKTINMDRAILNSWYVTNAIKSGADAVQFVDLLSLPKAKDVAKAKKAGLITNYCCADDTKAIRTLYGRGIDFVLSNDIITALQTFNSPEELPTGTHP